MSNKHGRTLDTLTDFLEKARRRLSDENPDAYEQADEEEYSPEEDLSEQSEDAAAEWLKERDPSLKQPRDEYDEEEPSYEDEEDEPAEEEPELAPELPKKAAPVGPMVRRKTEPAATSQPPPQKQPVSAPTKSPTGTPGPKRFMVRPEGATPVPPADQPYDERSEDELQPTREELIAMREYTRPWENRERARAQLEARPDVNPIKHHSGRLVEARVLSHADKQKAYQDFTNAPDYQNADPITQMDMDAKFHEDWHTKNPDHIKNALQAHAEAHKKGGAAKELHARAKDEKIRHIAGGGAQPEAFSVEEGLQHLGGGREDEDDSPNGITQDRSASFAMGNQEFLQQYMQRYNKRPKKPDAPGVDLDTFNDEARADIQHILGDNAALKNPAKKAKMDAFVARYYPQIERAKRRVISKLGLQDQMKSGQIDDGLFNFAGMHALFQAVNDYDHDHPSKAKFVTHLSRKMHGLMQTALKTQDEIPQEMRAGAKKFDEHKRNTSASPVKITDKHGNVRMVQPGVAGQPEVAAAPKTAVPVVRRPSHEIAVAHPPEVQDRLKRVAAAKQPLLRRGASLGPKPAPAPARKWDVRNVNLDDESGE